MKLQPHTCQSKVARFEELCRARRIPVTVQRRAVFEALLDTDTHPSAEELHRLAELRARGLSQPTVYRVLELLLEFGLITRVAHPASLSRFDANTDRHHHIWCDRCNCIVDVMDATLDDLRLPDDQTSGFEIHDHSVVFSGTCTKCRPAGTASPREA